MLNKITLNRKVMSGLLLAFLVLLVVFFAVQRVQARLQPIPLQATPVLAVETLSLTPSPFVLRGHYSGSVAAGRSVKMPAQIGAQVLAIHHREGERVKKGDLLIRLDDRELEHELKRLQATEQRLLADQEYWTRQHQRNLTLREKKVISARDSDNSLRMVDSLSASLVENAEAIASTRIRLGYTRIHAPFDGQIQALMTEVGDQTVPFLKSLIELVDESRLKAVVSVPQVDLARLKTGLSTEISVPAANLNLTAQIDHIYPVLAAGTRNATFEICLNCGQTMPLDSLYPGMALDATVLLVQHDDALTVPHQALQQRGNAQGVFVVESGKVRWRVVQPAEVSDGQVLIRSGLRAGEQVIITPDSRLKDGLEVRVAAIAGGDGR